MNTNMQVKGHYEIQVRRNGELIHEGAGDNVVTTAGMDYANNVALAAGAQTTTWYLALVSTNRTPTVSDTMTTLTGVEFTSYSGNRKALTVDNGTSASGVLSNSLAKAEFTLTGSGTLYGAALCSGATKGNSTGTLFSIANFDTAKGPLSSGDVVSVAYSLTTANAP